MFDDPVRSELLCGFETFIINVFTYISERLASYCHISYATPEQAQAALAKASTTKVRVGNREIKVATSDGRQTTPSRYVFITGLSNAGNSQAISELLNVESDAVHIGALPMPTMSEMQLTFLQSQSVRHPL
jgi:hypothetical protein